MIALLGCVLSGSTHAQIIATERVASGLASPLFVTAPAGDFDRLFIVEQGSGSSAHIKILDLNTRTVHATPFLTIENITTGGERGLLGLAFHSNYSSNGRFYVNYTDASGNIQIKQYTVSANPNLADADSASAILSVSHPTFDIANRVTLEPHDFTHLIHQLQFRIGQDAFHTHPPAFLCSLGCGTNF
jgi:hypothetical protein